VLITLSSDSRADVAYTYAVAHLQPGSDKLPGPSQAVLRVRTRTGSVSPVSVSF
jgi:hypothetical protein